MADPDQTPDDVTDARNPLTQVPVEIRVLVGTARPTIRDLLGLKADAIITLDRKVSDPVELFIGDRLIARGDLEEREDDPEGGLVVRLTEVAELDHRI